MKGKKQRNTMWQLVTRTNKKTQFLHELCQQRLLYKAEPLGIKKRIFAFTQDKLKRNR